MNLRFKADTSLQENIVKGYGFDCIALLYQIRSIFRLFVPDVQVAYSGTSKICTCRFHPHLSSEPVKKLPNCTSVSDCPGINEKHVVRKLLCLLHVMGGKKDLRMDLFYR